MCAGLVILIQFCGGIILLRQSESQMEEWERLEEHACNSAYLKQKEEQYEKLYYQMSKMRDPSKELIPQDLIKELQYFVMRAQFINPSHLPTLTESILAQDFNFANYLTKRNTKVLSEFI